MNHRSLAFRLAVWYALLLSATFALVGAGMFYGLGQYLRSSLADSLRRRSTQVEQILAQAPAGVADAAIAEAGSHTVDPSGSILELGSRRADGTLAAAPPGISSTGGKGEAAALDLRVAKSGRTTGLTCGGVSALTVWM